MIIDRIENAHLYYALHPRFKQAFDYVGQIDIYTIPVGRHEVDDDFMYVLVQEYNTKLKEEGKWEAHRRYIDLQYVVQGAEGMGYANIHHLQQGEYNASKDFLPLHGEGDQVALKSGCFVLLFPEDAHMPGMAIGEPASVKKIVLKIAVG
ncbi:MAG: YhcH/YjgK/YiaL family protein [Chloroflexi bacterium]|nr:YhcH/YjgK/YiaL family protein [Chloroflexota bacterium]MBI3169867.1 YhcH/YjgK/YiaL family protein [Chloroflexota bacterium]